MGEETGYTTNPTSSNKPFEELSIEEVHHETLVRLFYEANTRLIDPFGSPEDEALGHLILAAMSVLVKDNYEKIMADSMLYARWQAEEFARRKGTTLVSLIAEGAGISEEEAQQMLDGPDSAEVTEFNNLFKTLDTSFDA